MKRLRWFIFSCIIVLTMAGTLCAQNNEEPNFWFLEQGTEPTAENRIKAIQNIGRGLLDFAIYQPTGTTFPEEYRQKLLDAGFVFDFLTEEQLSQTTFDSATDYFSPIGRVSQLVVPETVSVPMEEIKRLVAFAFAFLGNAPQLPESMNQRGVISLADKKKEIIAEQQKMRERLIANPNFADKTEEEIETMLQRLPLPTSRPGTPTYRDMDQIGDDLAEAMGLFFRTFPENLVAKTGLKLLARRELAVRGRTVTDVFYIFANTKESAQPIDGWFRLRELSYGRMLMSFSRTDGTGGMFFAENDRAFTMDPATGKIGAVAFHHVRAVDRNDWYLRIQMKPGETLIVRVVRDRVKGELGKFQECFEEFESLPAWEYEGTPPEPPGK